jgi:dihydrofolate reductase
MRRIRYGVASSLDGYIAGVNDEYDWIPMDPDIDFAAMAAQFDTFLMGRRTYEMFAGQGAGGMEVWVFSNTLRAEDCPGVTVVNGNEDVVARLQELKARPGKDIALYGGGLLFRSLLELGVVDTVEIAMLPVLLGSGIPLLPAPTAKRTLTLTNHRVFPKTGTILLEYDVKPVETKRKATSNKKATSNEKAVAPNA